MKRETMMGWGCRIANDECRIQRVVKLPVRMTAGLADVNSTTKADEKYDIISNVENN